ncbi:MAG TPA: transposase, partial [Kiritimatiellia bacterium]|nr:transposase [Kiritimatiellia bacterium]
DVQEARANWADKIKGWDLDRLVFFDESGAKTHMTRFRGRAPKGARAYDSAPLCRWTVRTMISAIRGDGRTACMTIDAPTDGDIFQAFAERVLVPTLRPGDIVIMDNLGAHHGESVAAAIARAGAKVEYLPAYSPDLNPHREDVEQGEGVPPGGQGPDLRRLGCRHRNRLPIGHAPRRRLLVRLMWLYYIVIRSNRNSRRKS